MVSSFRFIVLLTFLLPALALAQNATLAGNVTDNSGGVVPGVTVTVTDMDTGRSQTSVTNENGQYRFPLLPAGTYRLAAEIPGFASVVMEGLELLVGQSAQVPLQLGLAGVEETVTVTGESPLVDVLSSEVAGNVDRRMMDDLPIQGRNWMALSLLVKGVTGNDTANNRPGIVRDEHFKLNLDGQDITQQTASSGFGQPKFSREAIAEFEIVTQQFDITQGRSAGMQVNAITRSGTNTLGASFYGYFRDESLNGADFVAGEVLPFENQQIGGTIGGAIVEDKLHYFVSYEYERQPQEVFAQPTNLPEQSFSLASPITQHSFTARVDHSVSDRDVLSYRTSYWDLLRLQDLGSSGHLSNTRDRTQDSFNLLGTWTRLWNDTLVSDVKVGYNGFSWVNLLTYADDLNTKPGAGGTCAQDFGSTTDQVNCQTNYVFPGLTIGGPRNYPQRFTQDRFSVRTSFNWNKGNHDIKFGGEYLNWVDGDEWHLLERGEMIFDELPDDIDRRFPQASALDPSGWDVSGLDSTANRFNQNVGDWTIHIPRPTWAIWLGDTWQAGQNLTLNFGIRYDLDWGALAPPDITTTAPFAGASSGREAGSPLFKHDIRDLDNIAPRFGFAYDVGGEGDLVIRGGSGIFYTVSSSNVTFSQQSFNGERLLVNSFSNDGLPGFVDDPTRGVTAAQIIAGEAPLPPQAPRVIAHDFVMPYTWQTSVGFQKQFGTNWAVEGDMVYWKEYNSPYAVDPNENIDPVTGYPAPRVVGRPDPGYTTIRYISSPGNMDYAALQTGLRRRFRDNFQMGATWTLMFMKNDQHAGSGWGYHPNNWTDPRSEWARSTDFQRNTVRVNGMYQMGHGVAVSGAYLFGSGNRFRTVISGNPLGRRVSQNRLNLTGAPIPIRPEMLDRFDGPDTIGMGPGNELPRNALLGNALHRLDLRLTKVFDFGVIRVTGIAELFNVLNHENFGGYQTTVNRSNFGNPTQNLDVAYGPRSAQFAFRIEF